jgi:hypothetical protein
MRVIPRYETLDEIRAIRWAGNHAADGAKMDGITEYVDRNYEADPESCKDALHVLSRDGMGVDERPDDRQLAEDVAECRRMRGVPAARPVR